MPWTWNRNTPGYWSLSTYRAGRDGEGWVVGLPGLFNGALNCANKAEINNMLGCNLKQICVEELPGLSQRMHNPFGNLYKGSFHSSSAKFTCRKRSTKFK